MTASRRDRRQQEKHQRTGLLLGIVGALIASLLVYQVFVRSDDPSSTPTAATPATAAASGPTTTTAPEEPSLPNGSFDELSLRDPFEPVGSTSSDTTNTTDTTTTTDTTPSDTIATTATTSPAQNPAGSTEIAVLDVTTVDGVQQAVVRVGTTEYTVKVGDVFATNYQLIRFVDAQCAEFVHGDATFQLCAGQQANK